MENKTIRVLYDDQGFFESHGGVSRYFTELIKNLPPDITWRLPLESTSNNYLREAPFFLPAHKMTVHDFIRIWCHGHSFRGVSHVYHFLARVAPGIFPSGELANRFSVREALRMGDFDIFHCTGPHLVNDDWKLVVGKKPIVVTVHDLIPELIYHDQRTARCRAKLLKAASHIIAVSENTKKDLIQLYKIPESKVSVIYHGYLSVKMKGSLPNEVSLPFEKGRYLIYVGKRGLYKNFSWFIRAIAPLLKEGLGLVCTGSPFNPSEVALLSELGVTDRVLQRFFSDAELKSTFRNALAFVYPSRYEGFGIPILDAFAAGCPVILPRASCFPEIASDAALYFDLDDADVLRGQIAQLLKPESSQLRVKMREKGLQRVSAFSWQKCAEKTADVYRTELIKA